MTEKCPCKFHHWAEALAGYGIAGLAVVGVTAILRAVFG